MQTYLMIVLEAMKTVVWMIPILSKVGSCLTKLVTRSSASIPRFSRSTI